MARRKDAWRFGQTNTKILGIGVTVAQQTLTLLVGVRFSYPQPYTPLAQRLVRSPYKALTVVQLHHGVPYRGVAQFG